jgi:hypothetical protein
MIERQRQSLFGRRPARRHAPPVESVHILPDRTVPGVVPPRLVAADEPTILGFPAEDDVGTDDRLEPPEPPSAEVGPAPELRLVALPRADPLAGIALVLAGVAALVSLLLPWRQGSRETGATLTRDGLAVAGSGLNDLGRTDFWQPPVIVIG